ncbi:competence protein TfoX [Planctomycetales bacterium]|nr:competence protein TfoX [Planctomycetales bacterium]
MGELSNLINIGKALEKQLNEIGVKTFDELKNMGSKTAWLKIRGTDSSACYSRLCALEGAIQEIRWHNLPEKIKKELKEFYTEVS